MIYIHILHAPPELNSEEWCEEAKYVGCGSSGFRAQCYIWLPYCRVSDVAGCGNMGAARGAELLFNADAKSRPS
jgi:hypothetical protein